MRMRSTQRRMARLHNNARRRSGGELAADPDAAQGSTAAQQRALARPARPARPARRSAARSGDGGGRLRRARRGTPRRPCAIAYGTQQQAADAARRRSGLVACDDTVAGCPEAARGSTAAQWNAHADPARRRAARDSVRRRGGVCLRPPRGGTPRRALRDDAEQAWGPTTGGAWAVDFYARRCSGVPAADTARRRGGRGGATTRWLMGGLGLRAACSGLPLRLLCGVARVGGGGEVWSRMGPVVAHSEGETPASAACLAAWSPTRPSPRRVVVRGAAGSCGDAEAPARLDLAGASASKPVWWSPHGERHNEAPARTVWTGGIPRRRCVEPGGHMPHRRTHCNGCQGVVIPPHPVCPRSPHPGVRFSCARAPVPWGMRPQYERTREKSGPVPDRPAAWRRRRGGKALHHAATGTGNCRFGQICGTGPMARPRRGTCLLRSLTCGNRQR